MIAILEDDELLEAMASDLELTDTFLDWVGAERAVLRRSVGISDAPLYIRLPTPELRRESRRTLVRTAPPAVREGVEEAEELVELLRRSVPSGGSVTVAQAQLPPALGQVADDDLLDEARLAMAGPDTAARDRIRHERFARLSEAAHQVASLGYPKNTADLLVGTPSTDREVRRASRGEISRAIELGTRVYAHTNSMGITYYLNAKKVTLRGGKTQTIYWFSKQPRKDTGVGLPGDRVVNENPRNGFLTLKRK
jgi:hypothetical protein